MKTLKKLWKSYLDGYKKSAAMMYGHYYNTSL